MSKGRASAKTIVGRLGCDSFSSPLVSPISEYFQDPIFTINIMLPKKEGMTTYFDIVVAKNFLYLMSNLYI